MSNVSSLTVRRRSPILAGLRGGAVLVLLSAFWVVFAPTVAGGSFSYVFTAGNSMEPVFHQGDLVLLRAVERYGIGEIVAFQDPVQGAILHRIRSREGNRFITRGDNRQSDDAFQATDSDIIGHVVGHVSGVGRVLAEIQTPRNTILLTLATLLLGAAGASRKVSLRRVRWQRPNLAGLAVQDRLASIAPQRWAAPLVLGRPGGNTLANGMALLLAAGVLMGLIVVLHGPTQV